MTENTLLIIRDEDAGGLVSVPEVIDIVEKVFMAHGSNAVSMPRKETLWMDPAVMRDLMVPMPACIPNLGVVGMKWVSVFPSNPQRGLPMVNGVIILNDYVTGIPVSVLGANRVTLLRTAGQSAVAAKYLANPDSSIVAIIGCGKQGAAHLDAMMAAFNLKEARLYDVNPQAIENLKSSISRQGVSVVAAASARDAVEGAHIVCMTSNAPSPIVMADWVSKGAFVTGIWSFYDLDQRITKTADKWVVGNLKTDLVLIVEEGNEKGLTLDAKDIYGDLGDIVTRRKNARESPDETIVYTHFGMGSLDVAVADLVYRRALERNIGIRINI